MQDASYGLILCAVGVDALNAHWYPTLSLGGP